jgi:hypothetical protein
MRIRHPPSTMDQEQQYRGRSLQMPDWTVKAFMNLQ